MTVFVGCPEGCRYHTTSAVYDLVEIKIVMNQMFFISADYFAICLDVNKNSHYIKNFINIKSNKILEFC